MLASLEADHGAGELGVDGWDRWLSGPDQGVEGLSGAVFTPTVLAAVRRRGWAQSLGEREPGVASVSAPVRSPSGRVIAAVSISGPIERLTRQPGRVHAETVMRAALNLTDLVRSAETTSS